jgi:hypothetical protein
LVELYPPVIALSNIFATDDQPMPRPPTLPRDAENTKVSLFFIGWPVFVRLDTFRGHHGYLRQFECILDLWALGDMLLPLPVTYLTFDSIPVRTAPQHVWIFSHVSSATDKKGLLFLIFRLDDRVDVVHAIPCSRLWFPPPLDEWKALAG